MKLKTRLVIAFFTIIIIPVLMAAMMVSMVCRYQIGVVEKNYGITGTTISDFTNSMQVLARVTEKPYHELKDIPSLTVGKIKNGYKPSKHGLCSRFLFRNDMCYIMIFLI